MKKHLRFNMYCLYFWSFNFETNFVISCTCYFNSKKNISEYPCLIDGLIKLHAKVFSESEEDSSDDTLGRDDSV